MPTLHSLRAAAAAFALMLLTAPPAMASVVLLEQPPMQQADAAANGTEGQAPRLAESFSFNGTAHTLAWWGSLSGGFQVDVFQGKQALFNTQTVSTTQAGFGINIDGVPVDLYVYSIDVGSLPGGTYILTVSDIGSDALSATWYWLHGSGGDGLSISGLGEPDQASNAFDLSLRVTGDAPVPVPAPATGWLAFAAGLAIVATRVRAGAACRGKPAPRGSP